MRCNRKIACFAVTPHRKLGRADFITEIWQLRRRQSKNANSLIISMQQVY
jgi:hypothetical protein